MDISPVTASQATTTQPAQSSAFSSLTDNIDTFLTLLTTQLQNQNPLDPLDTEQFTQQLVQFASVEQSIQTNTNLETLIALQTTTDRSAALDLIDRTISVNTDVAALEANGAEWTFQTASSGAPLTLTITNEPEKSSERQVQCRQALSRPLPGTVCDLTDRARPTALIAWRSQALTAIASMPPFERQRVLTASHLPVKAPDLKRRLA